MTSPDFVKRQPIRECDDIDDLQRRLYENMKERGATRMRFTYLPDKDEFIVEGWILPPERTSQCAS